MDKREGLEKKFNDWKRVKRKHIDCGHIRKFWGRLWEKKIKIKISWNCLHLKASQR
jgi:hypothetical protein